MVRLYGREREMELVREFLERPERNGLPRSRSVPVMLFTGARGSGKSALLTELAERLDQRVPYATVDCENVDADSVSPMLRAVAFELNRKCGKYGRLAFPRFVTGQIILAQTLDVAVRETALEQAKQALEDHRNVGRLRTFLADTAPEILSALPLAQQIPGINAAGRYLPELILNGLTHTWRRGRRIVLGEGQDWYGHQDRGLHRDPIDALVDLNLARDRESREDQREVAELLWAAFLADLRDGFHRKSAARTYNCVILLDNVDSPAGDEFIEMLTRARNQHAAHAPDDPDPLTIVATSRGTLTARLTAPGETVPMAEHASYADYLRRGQAQRARGCYPVRLRDLTEEEVGNMVAAGSTSGSKRRITTAVHRFTVGHPGSTRLILDAIHAQGTAPADLRAVLDAADPNDRDPEPGTIEDRLLHLFLQGQPDDVIDDLVACSAARDINQARLLDTKGRDDQLLPDSTGKNELLFAEELWLPAEGTAYMPPVLRRLLLRKLATHTPSRASWQSMHDWLRRKADDEVGKLYHSLALGELESVTRRLAELLPELDVVEWLAILTAVTAAPNALEHSLAPPDEVMELADWADRSDVLVAPLARLVAALWIDGDPLGDNHRKPLFLVIKAEYDNIAPYSSNGLAVLHGEAEKYHREALLTE